MTAPTDQPPRPAPEPPPYRVELTAPDIAPYRAGNTGVPYFSTFDSGTAGPHLMVTAVMHGNELCGSITLVARLRAGVRPKRGLLTLGFCNVEAYLSFNAAYPAASRFIEEDMNRVWGDAVLDGNRDTTETRRARQIRPLLDQADYLLDIHSMQHATVPLMLAGPLDKGRRLAEQVGVPQHIVIDQGHAAGRRMRDYRFFADPADQRAALLVECGQHWAAASADMSMASALRFLLSFGAIDQATALALKPDLGPAPKQTVIEITDPITVASDSFRFHQPFVGMEVIEKAGTPLGVDGDRPVVTPYDNCVLIMPSRRLSRGQAAVRLGRFLD